MADREAEQRAERWGTPQMLESQLRRQLDIRRRRVDDAKNIAAELGGEFRGFTLTPSVHHGFLPTPVIAFQQDGQEVIEGVVGVPNNPQGPTDNVYFRDPKAVKIKRISTRI